MSLDCLVSSFFGTRCSSFQLIAVWSPIRISYFMLMILLINVKKT